MTNDELKQIFQSCGKILEAKITHDKKTGESKVSFYYYGIVIVIAVSFSLFS